MKKLISNLLLVALCGFVLGGCGKMIHTANSNLDSVSAEYEEVVSADREGVTRSDVYTGTASAEYKATLEAVSVTEEPEVQGIPYQTEDGKYIVSAMYVEAWYFVTGTSYYSSELEELGSDDWWDGQTYSWDGEYDELPSAGTPVYLVLQDVAGTPTNPLDDEIVGWVVDQYSAIYDALEEEFESDDYFEVEREGDTIHLSVAEGGDED